MLISQILNGLAAWLAANDFGVFTLTGVYQPTDRAITLKRLPGKPDSALAVNVYDVLDPVPPVLGRVVKVQLRFRAPGPPDVVDDWADEVCRSLNYLHNFMAGDLKVSRAHRISFASLGLDENGREERTDNYELVIL